MISKAAEQLAKWGISPRDAERAGVFAVDSARMIHPHLRNEAAIVIPYFDVEGEIVCWDEDKPFARVRYVDTPKQTGFVKTKLPKYGQPAASGTHAYFAPVLDWRAIMDDPKAPIIITEGEAKGLAGCLAGFPVVALGGVDNFLRDYDLLPELAIWKWRGRDVYICYDSDAASNPNIVRAEQRLIDELQRKRGARCHIVRIPPDGDAKVGLDDYLVAHGPDRFQALLTLATPLGALDVKVLELNKQVAWIDYENCVYDLATRMFIPKDSFTNGNQYGSLTHVVLGATQRSAPREISIAAKWLKHPHAQRYAEILFRPMEGQTVAGEHGRVALNMWTGWEPERGPVKPFLDLTEYIFQKLPPEHRDLPLKLMAYKAQHPDEKVPLAIVLIGPQGCGKSMWGGIVRDAFAPYGTDVASSEFYETFQPWLEKSLLVLINEAEEKDIREGGETLKTLISEKDRMMNDKYRPKRRIKSYASYILTSNNRAVGSFAQDDRRMIVVDCPKPREAEFYHTHMGDWLKDPNHAKYVLNYLLSYELGDWRPPVKAPETAEKHLAYMEGLNDIQRLAVDMLTAKFSPVIMWCDQAKEWANVAIQSNAPFQAQTARATLNNIDNYQIRPWYTPEELTKLFPAVVAQMLGGRFKGGTPAGQISRQLREAGIPYLVCKDNPKGFMWHGQLHQYLIVHDFDDWAAPITQADFERLMKSWPLYRDVGKGGR